MGCNFSLRPDFFGEKQFAETLCPTPSLCSQSPAERQRYRRHLQLAEIGEAGQARLRRARVLVVGAGGLGCPILQYLAAAGVGTLGLADADQVELTNLPRQILYGPNDVGQPKVEAAARALRRLNDLNTYELHPVRVSSPENVRELVAAYDVVVDGSDNFPTRYLLNDACVSLGRPLVSGAIYKFEGQVSVFNYEGGPTYRCLFPYPPRRGRSARLQHYRRAQRAARPHRHGAGHRNAEGAAGPGRRAQRPPLAARYSHVSDPHPALQARPGAERH